MKKTIITILTLISLILSPSVVYGGEVSGCIGSGCDGGGSVGGIPTPPASISASASGYAQINVSWSAVDNADNYKLYRYTQDADWDSLATLATTTADVLYSDTGGLNASTTYYYKVKAVRDGNDSAWSATASAATDVLAIPANLSAGAGGITQINLTWNAVSGVDGYKLYRSTADADWSSATLAATTANTSYTDSGLNIAAAYYYRVKSYLGSIDSEFSATTTATTNSLSAPAGFTASAGGESQINLSWNAVSGAQGYEIYRQGSDGNWDSASVFTSTSNASYANSGLSSGATYYYRLKSYNGGNKSEFTATKSATTDASGGGGGGGGGGGESTAPASGTQTTTTTSTSSDGTQTVNEVETVTTSGVVTGTSITATINPPAVPSNTQTVSLDTSAAADVNQVGVSLSAGVLQELLNTYGADSNVVVEISSNQATAAEAANLGSGQFLIGLDVFSINITVNGNSVTSFANPLTLTFDVAGIANQSELTVAWYSTELNMWIELGGTVSNNVLTVTAGHLTDFSVIRTTGAEGEVLGVKIGDAGNFVAAEKELLTAIDKKLTARVAGKILLQVENHGEAWYVDPVSQKRYYLANGAAAYEALRKFGLGITNANLAKIPVGIEERFKDTDTDKDGLADKLEEGLGTDKAKKDTDGDGVSDYEEVINQATNPLGKGKIYYSTSLISRLLGRIVLQVESKGEAWYINPADGRRYYMKDGAAAYQIMRFLSLGITNENIRKIDIGEF
ncbi:hypothetical protein COT99_00715 [Candidatus Falkowbacteria bacterium CG10_big_fil_rev_8_21_14_0_10_43_10]|uniref:Fibronectin type-III domain-containing protein n=1 Tax=Candidatus Falkowbacteria bacterium CG10_big_fil_rev_8_21_14_0_10_43_10 TaxID=1974567 RepID=A0A2H0V2Z8_9BACT|nr:MAG: hypothetical protein COT99_00715 [Candidatus Falkowbacteria bacterium CG10_big_fil_rev_8_21_14_0_10_43_10]